MNVSISVVIPVYNRSKTIRYCLDSVLNQTLSPLEVLVVDDCSTDTTKEIVKSYIDHRVRCIELEKNSGAQAARNRGILEARGIWIAFQDSDDEWLPDKLEKQVAVLAAINFNTLTAIHTNCTCFDYKLDKKIFWDLPRIHGESVLSKLLTSPGPMFQGLLVSKIALKKIGLLDESVPSYQEWDTSISLSRECHFIHVVEPLFVYHLHNGETISKNKKRDIEGYQYVIDKYREEILEHCGVKVFNAHLAGNALKAMRWGYYVDASDILSKTLGNSAHLYFLKWMACHKINVWLYDVISKLYTLFTSRLFKTLAL